jgi:AcrR family transcriptional regulator
MLASRGLAAINTNSIARAAGVGVGTFYTHFPDKFALHGELLALGLAALQDALAKAHRGARDESVEQQVRATVAAFVDFAREHPSLYRVIFSAADASPRAGRAAVGFSARAMENRLRELQQAGQLEAALDVAVAARIFNAGQGQILLWWLAAPDPPPRKQLIETLVRLHPAVACRR